MAHTHNKSKFLMFYPEATVCVAPVDWAASGTRVEFITCDLAPKQELVVDPTAEGNPLAVGKRKRRKGIRNVDWTVTFKMHGTGATTAEDAQVAETYLSRILTHCTGGVHRSYSREVVSAADAHTLTVGNGLTTGFIPGCLIFVEDKTSPTDENEGKLHQARVIEVDALTHTITLSANLPFVPAAGDMIHGTLTIYAHRDRLKDAVYASGGPYTWQWLYRNDESGTDLMWAMEGSVATLALQNLGRGQLPQVQLNCMSANFRHTDYDDLAAVTMPAATGTSAQLVMGRDVQAFITEYGVTTSAEVEINQCAFETGIARSKVETGTEKIDRFEGLSSYSYTPSDTKFTATLVPFDKAWYEGLEEETEFAINYYQPGPGSGPGKAWGLHIARAQIVATPSRAEVGDVNGVAVEFSAMIPDDCTGGSNPYLEESPFLIGLA